MAKSTQSLIYNEPNGYHNEALQLLDRMQMPLNQSSDGFPDAASHVSPINCANAYLTLAQGSRILGHLSMPSFTPPVWCLVSAMRDKMPDYWVTYKPSGWYYANSAKRYSLRIHQRRGKFNVSNLLTEVSLALCRRKCLRLGLAAHPF